MKFRTVTKLDKKNTATLKNIDDDVISANCDNIVILHIFMTNLEPSRSRIPDAWSIKLTFLLIVAFYLKKTENRIKKSQTELSYYCFD